MNILLTNDDGINCQGLTILRDFLVQNTKHTIWTVAPDGNRSGVSNSISLHDAIRVEQRGPQSWAVTGTPADCVIIASLGALPFTPELVISGMNVGPNIGTDIIYSGTVAAARQGSLHNIPSMALSLADYTAPYHWEPAIQFFTQHIQEFLSLWVIDTFLNINFPNSPSQASAWTTSFPARRHYKDAVSSYISTDGRMFCFIEGSGVETYKEEGSDQQAIKDGLVSVSPVFVHPVVRRDVCNIAPDHAATGTRPVDYPMLEL